MRRRWEMANTGVPFEGAEAAVGAWDQVCGAAMAGDQVAQGAVREMLALGGGGPVTGVPGASALSHGVYGDPHGTHRGWGHHHMGAAEPGGPQARAWLAPYPDPTLASRQGLPMNTGGQKVPYNSTAIITSRPQRVAFRPERIFVSPPIGGTAGLGSAGWFINDITIGNRSQLVQAGGLPGDMFQNTSIDSFVTFETAQTSMDVVISTTLIDTNFSRDGRRRVLRRHHRHGRHLTIGDLPVPSSPGKPVEFTPPRVSHAARKKPQSRRSKSSGRCARPAYAP